ncbi:MAG: hypothetical protein JW810_12545 [Sedimentisphaerales bacterium]|nr:hypothetical protein [Sedimentisphaerales bacterium]
MLIQRAHQRTGGRIGVLAVAAGIILVCHAGFGLAGAAPEPAAPSGAASKSHRMVQVKRTPAEAAWTLRPTRILSDLPGFDPEAKAIALSKYGGRTDRQAKATGFFHPQKIDRRWWLIDPEGNLFIHIGVCTVRQGQTRMSRKLALERFGTWEKWAEFCSEQLAAYGFNGTGGWSDGPLLRQTARPPVYVQSWDFIGDFSEAKRLVWQEPGRLGYPNMCIPIFHPEFEHFCQEYARQLAATRDDPYLLGHFSDDELPLVPDMLDRSLQLDQRNRDLRHGYEAARQWLSERKGPDAGLAEITDEDRAAFLEFAFERYYRITTEAIRKIDANHLCLGSRLNGEFLTSVEVLRAAGNYLDVVAVNYFGAWGPDAARLNRWAEASGRPLLICEWYARGADSGLANQTGAGWLVPTQRDRGCFYQHFTLGLLENPHCVGWHWFQFLDNNPQDPRAEPSNRDSNKGIFSIKYEPYLPLLEMMRQINTRAYGLIDYFDAQ